jgi:hypothetical protein
LNQSEQCKMDKLDADNLNKRWLAEIEEFQGHITKNFHSMDDQNVNDLKIKCGYVEVPNFPNMIKGVTAITNDPETFLKNLLCHDYETRKAWDPKYKQSPHF